MMLMLARLALRNVFLNWRHSISAVLSVAAAFVALSVVAGYIEEVVTMYEDTFEKRNMLGQLLILPENDDVRRRVFDKAAQARVEAVFRSAPGADLWVPFLETSGTVSNGAVAAIFAGFGVDPGAGAKMRGESWAWNTVAGLPLEQGGGEAVVLGQSLGAVLGCEPRTRQRFITGRGGYTAANRPFTCENPLLQLTASTASGRANAVEATVSGLVDAAFKDIDVHYLVVPLALAQQLRGREDVSFYSLRVKAGVDPAALGADLGAALARAGTPALVQSWKAHKFGDFFVKSLGFLRFSRRS